MWVVLLLQLLEPTLSINGSPLPTTRPVTRIGNEWFLPIVPIARSLGIQMEMTSGPVLHVHRLDGSDMTYDGRTGEIRYRFLLIAQVPQFHQIQIDHLNDDLLFPLSGAVALLGLDVREDFEHNTLAIRTISEPGVQTERPRGSFFHMGGLEYSYGLNTNGRTYGQFANLRGEFLVGGIRTKGSVLVSRIPQRSLFGITQGNVRADISANRTVILGDQGIYSGVEALTNSVRGVGYETKFKGFGSYAYFGRSVGATVADLRSLGLTRSDSTVTGLNLQHAWKRGEWSLAGVHFDGHQRHGTNVGAAYRETRGKNQFLAQGVAGRGNGLVLADTFSPVQEFAITGRIERYSRNFVAAREDSHFDPQLTKSASITIRPLRYVTFNGGLTDRKSLSTSQHARNYSYGTSTILPGPIGLQVGFYRSIQIDNASDLGRFTLEQYFLTLPDFGRYSLYSHYSKTFLPGEVVRNLNTTAGVDLGRRGRVGVHDQLQFKKMNRYGVDWTFARGSEGFLRLGLDRVVAVMHGSNLSPVASLRLPFGGDHSLEITYVGEPNAHMLQFQFAGSARRGRELVRDTMGQASVAIATRLVGRVYLDTDLDGSFQAALDTPIPEVPVWLDDQPAKTDPQGQFRFDRVVPGAHTIRAELAGVPADFVFADIPERTIAVVPYRENILSFRVAKAGRVSGTVTYMDYTADPDRPVERPLPDAHIVAGSVDTFSEANGSFFIGDLIPGTYELKVDPTTFPDNYVPNPDVIVVTVKPGEHVQNVRFQLSIPPRPVIERRLPD